jgi:hypothetical protein
MKVTREVSLDRFEFWSGAEITRNKMTDKELEMVEKVLEETYNEIDEGDLNDIFWFETDFINEVIGRDLDLPDLFL